MKDVPVMSPMKLARALTRHGIHVDDVCDGDYTEDGNVTVASLVHVQVPIFGGAPRVIVETFHTDVRCYPPRTCVAELARDIRDALNKVPSAALASCSIH